MSEIWKIVLTASITIAGGVVVYVVGHFLEVLFIEPIHRLRSITGEIADSLVYYAPVYGNPGMLSKEICDEAGEMLRRQASQLRARAYSVPWYPLWALIGIVREKTEIEEASSELIGLSNSVYGGPGANAAQNYRKQRRIKELLGIQSSRKQKESQSINISILSHGILVFFFSIIILGVKESTLILWGHKIFAFPIWLYTALGIIALLISIALIFLVFQKSMAVKLERFLEERQKGSWRAIIRYLYFVVFWLVYIVGWLKGLSAISAERFIFDVVFWFGFIWFFIIPIVFLKAAWQVGKRE